jgi:hypothetical protein
MRGGRRHELRALSAASEKLTSVYLWALCGEIFINQFNTEDTEVPRGVLKMMAFQRFLRRERK